jgi:hypothetical protein
LDEKVFDLLFLKTDRYVEFKILLTNWFGLSIYLSSFI